MACYRYILPASLFVVVALFLVEGHSHCKLEFLAPTGRNQRADAAGGPALAAIAVFYLLSLSQSPILTEGLLTIAGNVRGAATCWQS